MEKEYLNKLNIPLDEILILDLYKDSTRKKTKNSDMKEYLEEVKDIIREYNIIYLVVCNSDYYKVLTKCNNINN